MVQVPRCVHQVLRNLHQVSWPRRRGLRSLYQGLRNLDPDLRLLQLVLRFLQRAVWFVWKVLWLVRWTKQVRQRLQECFAALSLVQRWVRRAGHVLRRSEQVPEAGVGSLVVNAPSPGVASAGAAVASIDGTSPASIGSSPAPVASCQDARKHESLLHARMPAPQTAPNQSVFPAPQQVWPHPVPPPRYRVADGHVQGLGTGTDGVSERPPLRLLAWL